MPDTNPVHRVFVTKKPSLRRDSHPEMKSFGDRRSNPATSDSDRGSPVNRRYGSYPSSPVAPVRYYQFEQKNDFWNGSPAIPMQRPFFHQNIIAYKCKLGRFLPIFFFCLGQKKICICINGPGCSHYCLLFFRRFWYQNIICCSF